MFGAKRTIPFWRPKPQVIDVERALAPDHPAGNQQRHKAQVIAAARMRQRLAAAARKKAQFKER